VYIFSSTDNEYSGSIPLPLILAPEATSKPSCLSALSKAEDDIVYRWGISLGSADLFRGGFRDYVKTINLTIDDTAVQSEV
jgi:hypothetical protein